MATKQLDESGWYQEVSEEPIMVATENPSQPLRFELLPIGLQVLGGAEDPGIDYFLRKAE